MDYQQREVFTTKRREFSRQSVLFGTLFIITFVVAVFIDLDGVLRFFNLISGAPGTTLEMGAIISAASAVPFLGAGMSISVDMYRNK